MTAFRQVRVWPRASGAPGKSRVYVRALQWLGLGALSVAALSAARAEGLRVVSLAPSVTETLFALGAGESVVGVSASCNYPPAARRVDRVGTFLVPNVEAVLAKRPDLVFAVPSPGNRAAVQRLEQLGLRVVVFDPQSVAETEAMIERVGELVGKAGAARDLVRDIEGDIRATAAALEGTRPRAVLMVVGHAPLVAVGAGVLQDELIRLAGGTNLGARAGRGWPRASIEWVIAQAPEVIVDAAMGAEASGAGAEVSRFWSRFSLLPAVREKRVFRYRGDALLRPGPRVGEAVRALARWIHPERFASDSACSEIGR